MGSRLYYLATSLPALDELGSPPPLGLAGLADHVRGTPAEEPTGFVLLGEDLVQRDAVLGGELPDPSPSILTDGQARGRGPLPGFLTADGEPGVAAASDRVWDAFWRHGAEVARRADSPFLAGWIRHEVGLRNALAAHRARLLGLPSAPPPVAPDLGHDLARYDHLMPAWAAAPNPLDGMHALLRARWMWALAHRAWYSFAVDEIVAYAVQLALLHQWVRMTGTGAAPRPGAEAAA